MQSDRFEACAECIYIVDNDKPLVLSVCFLFSSDSSSPCSRDRLRTTTNVLGDSLGAGIVEHLSRAELHNQDGEVHSSVIVENEKPYQLICQENDCLNHHSSETTM